MIYDINGNELTADESVAIKSYYQSEMADTISKVKELITEPSIVFPVITDAHRFVALVQNFEDMIHNVTKFAKSIKCDFVACCGDTLEGDQLQATTLANAFDCIEKFHSIGVPFLYAQGNHDNNPYINSGNDKFNINQVFKAFFPITRGVTVNFNENGTDYYLDFDGIDARVIVLNSCNVNKAKDYAYGDSTVSWLNNSALDADKTILLLSHISSISSQVWNNSHGTNASSVANALTSFVEGGGTLVQVTGHSHVDIAFVKPWLSVVNVCQKFSNPNIDIHEFEVITGYVDQIVSPHRTAGTYTEDAWTVCVLKPNSKEFDCIRFGAGADRYFHYDPIAPTTLSSRLSNVTWSSSDTSVATVSNGVVTGIASGTCGILAKDSEGNYECWTIRVQ